MINWSSIDRRSPLGRLLRAPLAAIPKNAVVPILSGPNRGFRWCVGAANHGCWLGTYELDTQHAIWRFRHEGGTALDVGANVGYYTLLLSRAVGPTGKVVAIEPDARNAAWVRFHTDLNHLRNVDVVIGAAAACTGTATFSVGPTPTTGRVVSDAAGEQVPSYSLDDIVFGGHLEIPSIVKMDIEGGESAALLGASRLLEAGQTTWFVALHSDEQAAACMAIYRAHRYRLCFSNGVEIPAHYRGPVSEIIAFHRRSDVLSPGAALAG